MATRDLLIRIIGDPSSAKKAMAETESSGSKMGATLGKVGVAAAAGVAAIGAAAVAFGADSLHAFGSLAGSVAKMQRLTGGTAEDMSRLAFEAKETGVSQETLEKSMLKLSKAAMAGNKAFTYYGIATKDAHGNMLPMKDVLENSADVFAKMPAGIAKNALAMQLFGKSGTDLLPMLNKGRKGLKELGEESDKYGTTIGQKSVDAYKKNVIAGRQMHAAMEGLKVQIGEKLMPIVSKITTWFAAHLPQAMAFVKKAIDFVMPAFQALGEGIAWVVNWVRAHWPQIHFIIEQVMVKVREVINKVLEVIHQLWARYGARIMAVVNAAWSAIKHIIHGAMVIIQGVIQTVMAVMHGHWKKAWEGLKKIVTGIWEALSAYVKYALKLLALEIQVVWDGIKAAAGVAWRAIKGAVMSPINAIKDAAKAVFAWFGHIWDGIESATTRVWNAIKNTIKRVVDDIKGIASGIWDGLTNGLKAAINWVIDKLNSLIHGINHTVIRWIPGVDNIPDVPHLATGGYIARGGLAVVGERGPELVSLPTGSRVHPNGSSPGGVTVNNYGIFDPNQIAQMTAREVGWALRAS